MVDIISVTTLIVAVITTVGVTVHKIGCRRMHLCCIDSDCRKGSNTPDSVSIDTVSIDTISINQIEPEPPKHEISLEMIKEEPQKTRIPSPTVRRKTPIGESTV
jgi:hypothetical protein